MSKMFDLLRPLEAYARQAGKSTTFLGQALVRSLRALSLRSA